MKHLITGNMSIRRRMEKYIAAIVGRATFPAAFPGEVQESGGRRFFGFHFHQEIKEAGFGGYLQFFLQPVTADR